MPSDQLIALCTSEDTVTRVLEKNPAEGPAKAAEQLFKKHMHGSPRIGKPRAFHEYTLEDLDRAARCGKFPYRPSDLFLKVRLRVHRQIKDF
jgi:hypothetical protein